MTQATARARLLSILSSRTGAIEGGRPDFCGTDAIEDAVRDAFDHFKTLDDIKDMDEHAKDIACKLFLRNIITFNLTMFGRKTEEVIRFNALVSDIMSKVLGENKTKLHVVK